MFGAGFLTVTLVSLFFVSSNAFSDNTVTSQTASKAHSISVEAKHPLAMAHQQLEQARQQYSKGDVEAVRKSLEAANKLLQDPKMSKDTKTINEVTELAKEIQQLQASINHPSDEHESAITRLWHRSSALVEREIEHVKKSWKDSSTANTTLKHLLDARLHFSYAENELFRSHNVEKANEELNKTVAYLDKADEVAIPRVREKIASLKKDIQQLPTSHINTDDEREIIQALEAASTSIDKASHSVSLEIQARSQKIAVEIRNLKKEVPLLERRHQYDSIMKRLRKLDEIL